MRMITELLQESARVKLATADTLAETASLAAVKIAQALKEGGKIMFCGNGGSAGDSQHLAAEFVATLDHRKPREGLAAIALTTDSSCPALTMIRVYIFDRQVETLGKAGDVLFALSTSGNSEICSPHSGATKRYSCHCDRPIRQQDCGTCRYSVECPIR